MGWSHAQISFLSVFVTAVGTTFLVGFFRHIGFSEFQISVYGSAIGFACFFCVFGSWFGQRKGHYKRTVMAFFAAAPVLCAIGVFAGAYKVAPVIVLVIIAFYQLFLYMAIPVLLSWLHGLVGQRDWPRFFSMRMIVSDISMLATVFAVGLFLGESPDTNRFLWMFSVAVILGFFCVPTVKKIPDPVVTESFPEIKTYLKMIVSAMRKKEILKLLIIAFVRSFAYGFIMPFQPLFLLEVLKFGYESISHLICLGTVFSIFFYKVWAYFQKRYGDFRSLKWNLLLSIVEPFLWLIAARSNPTPVYLAFALFGYFGAQGMVNAGFWPSFLGSVFQLSDESQKPVYTSLYYFVFGAATMFAPLIAGGLVQHFNAAPLMVIAGTDYVVDGYRIIFLIAELLLIATMLYAAVGTRYKRFELNEKEDE